MLVGLVAQTEHGVVQVAHVRVGVAEPVVELGQVIGWITLTVGGQTEDRHRVRNLLQLRELGQIAFFRIGDQRLQTEAHALLRQTAGELFGRAGLRTVEDNHISSLVDGEGF